jgi:hypothetical protein
VNPVLNLRLPWNAGKLLSSLISSGLSSSVQLHRVIYGSPRPVTRMVELAYSLQKILCW